MARTNSLKTLSRNATGGRWYGIGTMVETDDDQVPDPASCNAELWGHGFDINQASVNATFIAALVNAYRDGHLVEIQ